MRTVAVFAALLSVLAAFPPVEATDECATPATQGVVCVPLNLAPQGAPHNVYWGKYYLWIGPGKCTSPLSSTCTGDRTGSSGTPLPLGGSVPTADVIGVLFRESNGIEGLQRSQMSFNGLRPADHVVLV